MIGFGAIFLVFFMANGNILSSAQVIGGSDRTQQELILLGYTQGIRTAYCQQASIYDLMDPFREAIARMVNRYCGRNPAACNLKKSVTFTKYQIVLLEGYPRREGYAKEYRALNFRFFVVLPHDAIPVDKRIEKPLLSSQVLSEVVNSQVSELTHGLGWQVISYEKYPRFDSTTMFMNRWFIPLATIAGLSMIFLAYWVHAFTSGSSMGAWLVRGSSGGKNAALRRTMEIIEEQKYRFEIVSRQRGMIGIGAPPGMVVIHKSNLKEVKPQVARSLATSYHTGGAVGPYQQRASDASIQPSTTTKRDGEKVRRKRPQEQGQIQLDEMKPTRHVKYDSTADRRISSSTTSTGAASSTPSSHEAVAPQTAEPLPAIVVMHTQDSSGDTLDYSTTGRRTSGAHSHGRRMSKPRFSISDESRRKKMPIFGGAPGGSLRRKDGGQEKKRWKAGSMVLSRFTSAGKNKL